jgi:hypothetical protein
MSLPNKYITPDNNLALSIAQVRNDGRLTFALSLETDLNKYFSGGNHIDSLILSEDTIDSLFSENTLDLYTATKIYDR